MHAERLRRLQSLLPLHKIDFLVVTHLPNIRYLTGFTGTSGILLVGERQSVLITDGRYSEQARQQVAGAKVAIARKAPLLATSHWLQTRAARCRGKVFIGIEPAHMAVADLDRLTAALSREFRIKGAPPVVENQRMVKDKTEIVLLRKAVLAGAGLFDTVLKTICPGISETAVAAKLEYEARKSGCEGMAFDTIIASGPRSSLPHGRASLQPIPVQGFVVCDFGVILAGYCSDMTRTVYVGRPDQQARGFYQAVLDAQLAGISAVRPGIPVSAVDQAARRVLKKAGLGRYFTHSTGHGVGLEIHEPPRIAQGQAEILRPGMIITVEPGAYVPRRWGVRVEDMVVVTEGGCEVLTPTSKELFCI